VTDPGGQKPRGPVKDGLSGYAEAMHKAAPYTAAATSLVIAVGGCAWAGHWADGKLGFKTPWLTLAGALVGMAVGFVSFFRQIKDAGKDAK
jgi:ATP synthase protein I